MNPTQEKLQTMLERELDPGETIIWSASPSLQILWRQCKPSLMPMTWIIGFSSVLLLVLAFLYRIDLLKPEPGVQNPSILLFILSGVSAAFIPTIWFAAWIIQSLIARSTIYAITEHRAIVLSLSKNGTCTERDYRGDELIHLARTELPDGTGTLVFESARGAGATQQTASRHRFQGIENVLRVERMLRERFGNS